MFDYWGQRWRMIKGAGLAMVCCIVSARWSAVWTWIAMSDQEYWTLDWRPGKFGATGKNKTPGGDFVIALMFYIATT